MKVSIVRGGGIAGLVATTAVDSAALRADDAEELRQRVARALSPGRSAPSAGPTMPDELNYEIAIEDERGRQTVQLPEGQLSADERALIEWVENSPQREEHLGPPGRSSD
jgi:hypothetical protein